MDLSLIKIYPDFLQQAPYQFFSTFRGLLKQATSHYAYVLPHQKHTWWQNDWRSQSDLLSQFLRSTHFVVGSKREPRSDSMTIFEAFDN